MNPYPQVLRRLQAVRTALLLDQPFFGVLALQLKLTIDPGCGTAWTDGTTIAFDPAFVDECSQDELLAVWAHEVMHCACGHPWRRDAREPERWNEAADYAINPIIVDANFKLPKDCLIDWQYTGKAAEWIYDRLPVKPPQGNQGSSGSGSEPCSNPLGEVRDAPVHDPQAATEQEWKQATEQSLQAAKARGSITGSLARSIDHILQPIVDWRSVLRRYAQAVSRSDYSWTMPNRRYIASGLYLPALHSPACGRIAIAIDTSSSIDQVLLAQFAAEVQAIADDLQPESVDVLYCDTKVHRVDHFERSEPITIDAIGNGGTSFVPVFEQLQDDPPSVLVYLTDLDGSMPDFTPEYPVIWASTAEDDRSVPFGDVVPIA